ncbi:MAG: hypothetical protein GY733_00105, partial [bacterium]|nr:hypothetical protein [bacterium]
GRIEGLDPIACDGVIAQAVAEPVKARNLMLPWAKPGGWLAIPGTPGSLAQPLPEIEGCDPGQVRPYRVPEAEVDRLVWLARKAR